MTARAKLGWMRHSELNNFNSYSISSSCSCSSSSSSGVVFIRITLSNSAARPAPAQHLFPFHSQTRSFTAYARGSTRRQCSPGPACMPPSRVCTHCRRHPPARTAPPPLPSPREPLLLTSSEAPVFRRRTDRLARARDFVRDALGDRPLKMTRLTPLPVRCYRVLTSHGTNAAMVAVSWVHVGLGFYEPPSASLNAAARDVEEWPTLFAAELAVLGCYWCFNMLDLYANWGSCFAEIKDNQVSFKPATLLRFGLSALFSLDFLCVCVAAVPFLRFSRFLRPWYGVLFSANSRSVLSAIVTCAPILDVVVILAMLLVVFSMIGAALFAGVYKRVFNDAADGAPLPRR